MAKAARSLEREPDIIEEDQVINQPQNEHIDPPVDDGAEDQRVTERRARAQGWVPQDQFRGDATKWVDAETFLEKGYGNNDILRERIDRLADKLSERDGQIGELNTRVAESGQVLRSLNDRFINADRNAYDRAKADIRAEMRRASEEADPEAHDRAQAKLDALEAAPPKPAVAPTPARPAAPAAPQLDAVTTAWRDENMSWWQDDELSSVAIATHRRLLASNPYYNTEAGQRAGYDAAKAEVMRRYPERFENARRSAPGAGGARQPSGDRGNGRSNGNGRSFANLPAAAKAEFQRTRTAMGPDKKTGKPYFTEEMFLDHYVWDN